MGIKTPTEIQRKAIPSILKGKNVCGRAETGSGKTAAFALPILEKLSEDPFGIFAIVLTPARELAIQIAEQFQVLGSGCNVQVCTIIGGMDMTQQTLALSQKPHVVVATPGRLADLVGSGCEFYTKFSKFLVLDEVDRLLQPEFKEDLKVILNRIPPPEKRQTLLFSATMSFDQEDDALSQLFSKSLFENIVVSSSALQTVESVRQSYVFMPQQTKYSHLVHVLREELERTEKSSVIVFVGSVDECEIVSATLLQVEIDNVGLFSKLSQNRRLASLGKFKGGLVRVLVASDVASRGLDIDTVDLVVNFDVPRNSVDYVHRIGRTARAGKIGKAVTFVSQYEIEMFLDIEKQIGVKIETDHVDDDEIVSLMKEVEPARRLASIRLQEFEIKSKKMKRTKQ